MTKTASMAMIDIRPFNSIGAASHGWLDAHHHFSFASYHDPARMNWGNIRVWNDDEIAAQSGFPPHPHDNMEIITYVREGAITHRDSMDNVGRTEAGDVQVMSAGTGVKHSEYNLEDTPCRLFQIWIHPRERNIAPRWDQAKFPKDDSSGIFHILASGYGDDGALVINADARVLGAAVTAGHSLDYTIEDGHHAYLVVAHGSVKIGDRFINSRDGVAIGSGGLRIEAIENAELVMVDSV